MSAIQSLATSLLTLGQFANNHATEKAQVKLAQAQLVQKEQARRDLLNRQMANARAKFAARGVGSSGSTQALMAGLTQETEQAIGDDRQMAALGQAVNPYNSSLAGLRTGLEVLKQNKIEF